MHPVLLASYFFTFLSLVVSKPYGISLSARADFCSSCKCGDLANCRTQCDKCSEAPGSCTYSDGTPCDTGQTVCDSCTYDGCKKNCQCWFYCADTAKQCPLKGGNCVSDKLILNYRFSSKTDMMALTRRILSAVVIAKRTVYVKILLSNI